MSLVLAYPPFASGMTGPPAALSALGPFLAERGVRARLLDLNAEFFWYVWDFWPTLRGLLRDRLEAEAADPRTPGPTARYLQHHLRLTLPLLDTVRASSTPGALAVPTGGAASLRLVQRSIKRVVDVYLLGGLANGTDQLRASMPALSRKLHRRRGDALLGRFLERTGLDRADTIGFSLLSESQLPYAMAIAGTLRDANPRLRTVIGGPYVAEVVEGLTADSGIFQYFDHLVLHEGESALLRILSEETGRVRHPNVVSATTTGGSREAFWVEDIDQLPAQDFSQFDLDLYRPWGISLPLYSSKGCSWGRCAFCSTNFLRYRERELSRFYRDATAAARESGVRTLQLVDEDVRPERLQRLAELSLGNGEPPLEWMIQTRFYAGLDRELLGLAARAGFKTIEFGLESASRETLRRTHKGISLTHVERTIANCADAGTRVVLNFMIGFPWESEAAGAQALDFVDEMVRRHPKLDLTCNTQAVKVYVHSALHRTPQRYGVVSSHPLPLSPITSWRGPEWVEEFMRRHRAHLLLNGRSSLADASEVASGEPPEEDLANPSVRLAPHWFFLPAPIPPTAVAEWAGPLLVREADGCCEALRVNMVLAEAVAGVVEGSSLAGLKQRFVRRFAQVREAEALRALGDALRTLNQMGALSFYAG